MSTKNAILILPLFRSFLKDCQSGRRTKKDGTRIKVESIENYTAIYKNLEMFSQSKAFSLRIIPYTNNKRQATREARYWRVFYRSWKDFLFKRGCRDNYVGVSIKIIRVFFKIC
jgi:hypothetical protein